MVLLCVESGEGVGVGVGLVVELWCLKYVVDLGFGKVDVITAMWFMCVPAQRASEALCLWAVGVGWG
jgi:hypothetical protein